MRIVQILSPRASEYDRKSQRIDLAALPAAYGGGEPALAHLYGPVETAPSIPYVASQQPRRGRFSFRLPRQPERLIAPMPADGRVVVPEAVEDAFFAARGEDALSRPDAGGAERIYLAGVYGPARPGVRNMVEQTRARLHRFREDIEFRLFESTPQSVDFDELDVWIDPATDDSDLDGFLAEAMVRGLSVIAARTPINVHRSEHGRTAILVPLRDPNELTHAILAALFKPEVSDTRRAAARQTISKFRPRQRARALSQLYESLASK